MSCQVAILRNDGELADRVCWIDAGRDQGRQSKGRRRIRLSSDEKVMVTMKGTSSCHSDPSSDTRTHSHTRTHPSYCFSRNRSADRQIVGCGSQATIMSELNKSRAEAGQLTSNKGERRAKRSKRTEREREGTKKEMDRLGRCQARFSERCCCPPSEEDACMNQCACSSPLRRFLQP